MPDTKISADPTVATLTGPELFAVVQTAINKSSTAEKIRNYILQSVTTTELAYLSGLTSNAQMQFDTLTEFAGAAVLPKTSTYATARADNNKTLACSGTFTVTLQTAAGIGGAVKTIKNTGTGVITIDTTGGQTIDGNLTELLSLQYECVVLQSDGANWMILSRI